MRNHALGKIKTLKNQIRCRCGSGLLLVLLLMIIIGSSGCGEPATRATSGGEPTPVAVAATNVALADMARAIAGDEVDVFFAAPKSTSNRMPDADTIGVLQRADVVFTNGRAADDAPWLSLVSVKESKIQDTTTDQFELDEFIQVEDYRSVHSHGDEGEHSHPWLVPQCWLNPRYSLAQAESILSRLKKEFPQHTSTFEKNFETLRIELEEIGELADQTGQLLSSKGLTIVSSDPRLLFFTRALKQDDNYLVWFDLPEKNDATKSLTERLKEKRGVLLWAQPPGELAQKITDEAGGIVVQQIEIDLIEKEVDGGKDYLGRLRQNFKAIETTLERMSD